MQPYLITYKEVHELARKMSQHIEADRIDMYIREAENMDLKPVLGDGLMIAIKGNPSAFKALLNGGVYVDRNGVKKSFEGLKSALAYFTYARFVRNDDGHVTRSGFMVKDNEHSARTSETEKERAYNDAVSIARRYLNECMEFSRQDEPCKACCGTPERKQGKYKVLGD